MKRCILVLLLAPLVSAAALAEGYAGPGAIARVGAVAAALGTDATPVALPSRIVKRRQDQRYPFKAASGTRQSEIDDEGWPAQAAAEQARVKLTGAVERDLSSREIDVDSVELGN